MTVKVTGTNFSSQAAILWNGAQMSTTIVDANTLSGTIGSSSLASPGTARLQVQNTQTMQESPAVQVTITAQSSGPSSPLTISNASVAQGVVGTAYTSTLVATGGTAPYTWSVTSGQLPTGFSLAPNSGAISGTPTSAGSYSFGVSVTDSGSAAQSATTTVTLTVSAAPVKPTTLAITSPTLPAGSIGSTYATLLQATGGTAPYSWSIGSGSLPTGLNLSPGTGAISGTPTTSGTFNFTASVSDAGNPAQIISASFSIVIAPVPLTIVYSSLPGGTQNSSYASSLHGAGGTGSYTWSISSGSLPAGLSLTPATGVVSGTPAASGNFSFGATVRDSGSPAQTATTTVTLSIVAAGTPVSISSTALPGGTQNQNYSGSLNAVGGAGPYTWSVSGSLPAGLTLNPATGVIAGTPTASGASSFTVTVKDSSTPAQTSSSPFSIGIAPPALTINPSLASGSVGTPYTSSLSASGGTPAFTWSVSSGALPGGLTLNAATGVISGTPTASGAFAFGAMVKDSGSPAQTTATIAIISIIAPATPLSITSTGLPGGTKNQSYSGALSAAGGTAPYTWSMTGSLPVGLTLNPASGTISGSPTATGTTSFNITVKDSSTPAQTSSLPLSIIVSAPAPLTISALLPPGTVGTAYSSSVGASGGAPTYTWSISVGTLPPGLTIAPSTGIISGTPTTSGTYNFTAAVSDSSSPVSQNSSVATSIVVAAAQPGVQNTWYVRPDGGTRYSSNQPTGQCDGLGDAAYPGSGTNQHCAFNDVRYFWTDGAYCTDNSSTSTCWTWIGQGGDTYIVRGSIGTGVTYRIGQNGPNSGDWFGLAGNPYGAGIPVPHSGTANAHTRFLGENYASCSAQSARTQLHGGYGVGAVLNMGGASYVDVACFDITDFSSCGRSSQLNGCNTNFPITDFAGSGIAWNNTSTNDTITDVRIHGMASLGMTGSTGNGVVMTGLDIIGNAGAGWNADAGDGLTGLGSLLVQNYTISWNGCAEEYPIVDALPYQDCTDDNIGGYGDGFGTATVLAQPPGWQVHFDQGVVSYNTQDGLDALHLIGNGSTMTITRTLAYGNMGQQIKVGGSQGTAINNIIFTNCNAMRQAIPGTPSGYNSRLSDFCRAADTGVVMTVGAGTTTVFDYNTVYSASATGIEVDCGGTTPCDATALIDFRNNIFLGFPNTAATGYPNGGTGDYSNPIYMGVSTTNPFTNPGSVYSNNVTYHWKSSWTCPAQWLNEANPLCVDPALTDETWHLYGYGDATPTTNSVVHGAGVAVPAITIDYTGTGRSNPPSIGAYN